MADIAKTRFLVVDDNAAMRKIVRALLDTFGAETVEEAANGLDALARMKTHPADIVITDCEMPDLNGVDFVKRLRSQVVGPAATAPVIMLTAHAKRPFVVAARDAGVTEFCAKPVTALALWKRIVAVMDKPRPFVKDGGYLGPCRRRNIGLLGPSKDRRRALTAGSEDELLAGLQVKSPVEI